MYIPSLLFGQANTCISGSGFQETGEFISGSVVWKYFKFTTQGSGSFVIESGSTTNARVFLVGGGAGGGVSVANATGGSPRGAGGGGAGGVVYTDYRLGPGTYTYYIGDGGSAGVDGEDTWIQMEYLPSDYNYYDPTSTFKLTAEGGGRGAYFHHSVSPYAFNANAGGSGGGAGRGLVSGQGYLGANKGGGRVIQGNDGGIVYIPGGGSTSFEAGAGGGGAGGVGEQADFTTTARTAGRGGHAKQYNIDGNNTYYAAGGGGLGEGVWPDTNPNGANSYGSGGSGSYSNYPGGNPGSTPGGHDKRTGRQGVMAILVPVCRTDLFECTTYQFDGGASGGDITYIPCGESYLQTDTVNFGQTGSFCTYPITGDYPTTTGTVSLTATGSCFVNQDIPTLPTCSVGEVTANAYTYNIQIPTACYPTPSSCQQVREASSIVTYTKFDGTAVTQSIGGGTGDGLYQICAREYPAPTLSCGSFGAPLDPTCSITKTSNICGYFCTSSV